MRLVNLRTLDGPFTKVQRNWLDQKPTEVLPVKLHKYFMGNTMFDINRIMTMYEFLSENQDWHGQRNKYLVCHNPDDGIFFPTPTLFKGMDHADLLLQIIRDKGFDFVTTRILLPKVLVPTRDNLSVEQIGRELFFNLPIYTVTGMYRASNPNYILMDILEEIGEKQSDKLLVKDVLKIKPEHLSLVSCRSRDDYRKIHKVMDFIQGKFREFSLDHPFMEEKFGRYAKAQL